MSTMSISMLMAMSMSMLSWPMSVLYSMVVVFEYECDFMSLFPQKGNAF